MGSPRYRTMKLLCEAGLAKEVSFRRGVVRYEQASDWHHDHLICECCGKSIEVVDLRSKPCRSALSANTGLRLRNTGCICTASVRTASLGNLLQDRL